jgi:hypothetical protein
MRGGCLFETSPGRTGFSGIITKRVLIERMVITMKCTLCGFENTVDAIFCNECGNK